MIESDRERKGVIERVLNGRLLPQSNDSPASSDKTNGRQAPLRVATASCRPRTAPLVMRAHKREKDHRNR